MRDGIDEHTIKDLEFDQIRDMLASYCNGETARVRMEQLTPHRHLANAEADLDMAAELLAIREEESGFPALAFEELNSDIQKLGLKGAVLEREGFARLIDASRLTNDLIYFFDKRDEDYPMLHGLLQEAYFTKEVIEPIEQVLDRRMEVKDDASAELLRIRNELRRTKSDINRNFDKALRKLTRQGFLADTHEAYIHERRVLSVLSQHKREVHGNVVGASKTGSITYIEPRENMTLNHEFEMLQDDERAEIRRIFLALTDELRVHLSLIKSYQRILSELDFVQTKVRLARQFDGARPALQDDPVIELINGYHPLLLLNNREKGLKTIPQSLTMDKLSRMLIISGPNAGGKSITLKTVGLLQLMVQSGLLVPCDPSSRFGWFHSILLDIGDNQSIANQLSTYSYRLQRMKYFLDVANKRSLLLLDEFGTGSDPELGGALAEVFFETLYNRKCFGVITTHYANIKLKAARLRNAVNASMLFDSESLEPLFQLSVGQPGSSFTFEVAQINGIPKDLIEEAKLRLDANKVEMDQLIAALQKEKSEVESLNKKSKRAEKEAMEAKEEYQDLVEHYEQRLLKQQELIEKNNKDLSNGKKMGQFIQSYRMKGHNKNLMEEVRKFLAIEKSKIVKKKEQAKVKKAQPVQVKPARKVKKKPEKPKEPPKPILVGSTVQMQSGSQKGEVVEIKGKEATVLFGNFKTKVKVADLHAV